MSTVFEAKPQASQNLAEMSNKLEFQQQAPGGHQQDPRDQQHRRDHARAVAGHLRAVRRRPPDHLRRSSEDKHVDHLQGQDRADLVQGPQAADQRAEHRRLRRAAPRSSSTSATSTTRTSCEAYSPQLNFLKEVDKRTGYRTKQMLVAPVLDAGTNELIGVVQVINSKSGQPFSAARRRRRASTCARRWRSRSSSARSRGDACAASTTRWSPTPCCPREEMELATALGAAQEPRHRGRADRRVPGQAAGDRRGAVRVLRRALRAVQAGSHQADGPAEEPQARLRREQRLGAARGDQGRPDRAHHRSGAASSASRIGQQRLSASARSSTGSAPSASSPPRSTSCSAASAGIDGLGRHRRPARRAGRGVETANWRRRATTTSRCAPGQRAGQARQQDHHRRLPPGCLGHPHRALSRARSKTEIRFRKDGSLQPYIAVPASYRNALVARLKIMCDLDISEKRKPQDGKIKFKKFGPLDIELRVATIPSQGGVEDIVMRILAAGEPIPLDKLGLSARNLKNAEGHGHQALRPVLRLRPDRFGQDDDAALGARLPQHAGHQDLDRRGPGGNHPEGPAPGADEPEGGARLRGGDEGLPARRSGHHHGRRDARQGNHRRSASRPRSPATWCSPPCTPTARRNRSSACSTWAWTRSTSPMRCSASWPSAWPSACAASARSRMRRRRRRLKG